MSITIEQIKIRHDLLVPVLDEKQYRLYLAAEAKALGWGGVSQVAKVANASRNTISTGIEELEQTRGDHLIPPLIMHQRAFVLSGDDALECCPV